MVNREEEAKEHGAENALPREEIDRALARASEALLFVMHNLLSRGNTLQAPEVTLLERRQAEIKRVLKHLDASPIQRGLTEKAERDLRGIFWNRVVSPVHRLVDDGRLFITVEFEGDSFEAEALFGIDEFCARNGLEREIRTYVPAQGPARGIQVVIREPAPTEGSLGEEGTG